MPKNRWLLLGLLLACIVGVVLAALALLPPRPGVTKENFDRIEICMTRAEVEAIFGEPGIARFGPKNRVYVWEGDSGNDLATIHFDEDNRVAARWHSWPDDRTVWEKLLDRLPWREKPARPSVFLLHD